MAAPPGMFSLMGAMAVTRTATPSVSSTVIAAMTIAAPDMSVFMVVMPPAVLRDSPPESKVTPLPTSTMWRGASASLAAGSSTSV